MFKCAPAVLLIAFATACGPAKGPDTRPPGADASAKVDALKTGSALLQKDAPPDQLNVYIAGLHPMKDEPGRQMAAHHFCKQVNEDFAQCVLFDGNGKDANLNGIEYIVSAKLFGTLPADEKKLWHPHNYEILSGQLVAPGIPDAAEKELMRTKMNSYGKTWHLWNTGHNAQPGDKLPLGTPKLAWSLNRDGEADPALFQALQTQLQFKTEEKRAQRQDLSSLAQPQSGVDDLNGKFGRPTKSIPGVTQQNQVQR